ncbi:MAG: DMT family transporter [Bacteroidia bacterium]|nr:DMT family transporter [Bacteroidia bacterium]
MGKRGKQRAYLEIHTAVFLYGFTAILGKLIVFDQLALVWHRLWIAVIGLSIFPGVIRGIRTIPPKRLLTFLGIGIVVSLHWVSFFGSVKLGNVSVALACLATSTLFISILEPIITRSGFKWFEMFLGLMAIAGIVLVLDVGEAYYRSIIVGLIAAFLAALFSSLNKKYIGHNNALSVSVLELASGFAFLSLVIVVLDYGNLSQYSLFRNDLVSEYSFLGLHLHSFWYLLLLGLLCTSLAYGLTLSSLKVLSAFSTGLAVNLEPVYGVLMAIAIFHENKELTPKFYVGTGLILLSVLVHPFLASMFDKKPKKVG